MSFERSGTNVNNVFRTLFEPAFLWELRIRSSHGLHSHFGTLVNRPTRSKTGRKEKEHLWTQD